MEYIKYAIDKLKKYRSLAASLENLKDEIVELHTRRESLRSSRYDAVCVGGADTNRAQDALLNSIVAEEEKKRIYMQNSREIKRVSRALSVLRPEEYDILKAFYIDPVQDPIKYLREVKHFEKTWIYDTRREALHKFTRALYGAID